MATFIARHPRLAALLPAKVTRPGRWPVRVAGLEFPNPIGLAAGLDKTADAPLAWIRAALS